MLGASSSVTRGHNLRLNKFRVKYDLRKYFFTSRVVNVCNCLSSFIVSADSVNCFKNRLDNFRKNQDIIYDYQPDIHGTRNRSKWNFDSTEEIVIVYIRNRLRGTSACKHTLMSTSTSIIFAFWSVSAVCGRS